MTANEMNSKIPENLTLSHYRIVSRSRVIVIRRRVNI